MAILFLDDWVKKHKGAIIHESTKNQSFLNLVKVYKNMEVENYFFILALHNKDLLDINPHDPDLGIGEIAMVVNECVENPWYYIREVAKIPPSSGTKPVMFKANRGTINIFWLFHNHITNMVQQPRQTYKTITVGTLMRYLLNIKCYNTKINLLALDEAGRQDTLTALRSLENELPHYLRLSDPNNTKNPMFITVPRLSNMYRGFLPQKSTKAARNVMRGKTSPVIHCDEVSSAPNIDISLPVILSTGNAAVDEARDNNEPHGTILTFNAGKKADRSAFYIYKNLMTSCVWSEKLFDAKDEDDLHKLIRKNSSDSKTLRVASVFNHRQLGFSDDWLRERISQTMAGKEAIETDFLNRWYEGTTTNPLDREVIESMKESEVADYRAEIAGEDGYIIRWYVTEEELKLIQERSGIIVSLDTSDAVGSDDIALVAIDIATGANIAVGDYNETNVIAFADYLVNSWLLRFDRIVMNIERRSTGVAILDAISRTLISKGVNPFTKLFNWVVQDLEVYVGNPNEILNFSNHTHDLYIKHKKSFGFATSGAGRTDRNKLYGETLTLAAKYTQDYIFDMTLIAQISGLLTKNGRIDHGNGEHDDLVIAWLLSFWLLYKGTNLDKYNINVSYIMSSNNVNIKLQAKKNNGNVESMQRAKDEILRLTEEVVNERSPYLYNAKITKLKKLIAENKGHIGSIITLEELNQKLENERKVKF